MGNVFMPSVASTLNQASGDSLLQILQQRMLQQEMQKQMLAQQQKGQADQFGMAMRLQSQGLAERKFAQDQQETADRTKAAAAKDAEAKRAAMNTQGAAGMVFDRLAMDPTDRSPGLLRAAHEGKVGVSMLPKEPAAPKPTLSEKVAEATALTEAREKAKQKFKKPTGVKVAKEDTGLPSGFRQAIANRIGKMKGFEDRDAALKSIKADWPKWRSNYPNLDASKVKSELDNLFGPRETAQGGSFLLNADQAAAIARGRAEQAKGVQR